MNYYQFHVGDYVLHTAHLSPLEDIAYRRLLDLYYTSEEPIPLDVDRVAKLIRMREQRDIVAEVLSDFFVLEDDGYHSKRADAEISKYKAMVEGGKSGANKRWNREANTPPITEANTPPNANQEPVTNNQEPLNTPITPKGVTAFLEECKARNEKPIPEDDPVFEYAEKAGIPTDYLRLCWREFVEQNREKGKRYKDWRKAFRNCVRNNWYKIWYRSADGSIGLTTQGLTASKIHKEAA